jgi:uncharacterized protein YidB (DUF937 family)
MDRGAFIPQGGQVHGGRYGSIRWRWVSTGPNLPINAEQIQQALGSEKVREMAAKFGIPVDKVADLLAKHLPPAID